MKRLLLGGCLCLFCAQVRSEGAGPYLYMGFGQARHDKKQEQRNLNTDILARPSADASTPKNVDVIADGADIAARMGFGFRLSRYVALEMGLVKLGDFSMTGTVNDPAVVTEATATTPAKTTAAKLGRVSYDSSSKGIYYQLQIGAPIARNLSMQAKWGAVRTWTSYRCTASIGGYFAQTCAGDLNALTSTNVTYGVGLQYDLRTFLLRLDADRVENIRLVRPSGEGDVNLVSLGIVLPY